jgi:hypothetical protein
MNYEFPQPLLWEKADIIENTFEAKEAKAFNDFGKFEPNFGFFGFINIGGLVLSDQQTSIGSPDYEAQGYYYIKPIQYDSYQGSGAIEIGSLDSSGNPAPNLIYNNPVTLLPNSPGGYYYLSAWVKFNSGWKGLDDFVGSNVVLTDYFDLQFWPEPFFVQGPGTLAFETNSNQDVIKVWQETLFKEDASSPAQYEKQGIRDVWIQIISRFQILNDQVSIKPALKFTLDDQNAFPVDPINWIYRVDNWQITIKEGADCRPDFKKKCFGFEYCLPAQPAEQLAFSADFERLMNDLKPGQYDLNLVELGDCLSVGFNNQNIGTAQVLESGEGYIKATIPEQADFGCYYLSFETDSFQDTANCNQSINLFPIATNGKVAAEPIDYSAYTSITSDHDISAGINNSGSPLNVYDLGIKFDGIAGSGISIPTNSVSDNNDSTSYKFNLSAFQSGDSGRLITFAGITIGPYVAYDITASIYVDQVWDGGGSLRIETEFQPNAALIQDQEILPGCKELPPNALFASDVEAGNWYEINLRIYVPNTNDYSNGNSIPFYIVITFDLTNASLPTTGVIHLDNLRLKQACDHEGENLFPSFDNLIPGELAKLNWQQNGSYSFQSDNITLDFAGSETAFETEQISDSGGTNQTIFETPSIELAPNTEYYAGIWITRYDDTFSDFSPLDRTTIFEVIEGNPSNPGNPIGLAIRRSITGYLEQLLAAETWINLDYYLPASNITREVFLRVRQENIPSTSQGIYSFDYGRVIPYKRWQQKLECVEPPLPGTDIVSSCISVINPAKCNYTSKIRTESRNGNNELGYSYKQLNDLIGINYAQNIRLEIWPQNPQFPSNRKVSKASAGQVRNIYAKAGKVYPYETFFLPNYLHEYIALLLIHSRVWIKREDWDKYVEVTLQSDHKPTEIDVYPNPEIRKAEGKLAVTPYQKVKDFC